MKIRISEENNVKELEVHNIAKFCLNSCGGGYTESQTARAMGMLYALNIGQPFKINGFTVENIS